MPGVKPGATSALCEDGRSFKEYSISRGVLIAAAIMMRSWKLDARWMRL
jgi:hypothetical protein